MVIEEHPSPIASKPTPKHQTLTQRIIAHTAPMKRKKRYIGGVAASYSPDEDSYSDPEPTVKHQTFTQKIIAHAAPMKRKKRYIGGVAASYSPEEDSYSDPEPTPKHQTLTQRIIAHAAQMNRKEIYIRGLAESIASEEVSYSDPDVWAVLSAISDEARKRPQGSNMILNSDEHCVGRLVADAHFQILSNQVSAQHCKIYRKKIATEDVEQPSKSCTSIFLKDTSKNGTYLNWEKLNKQSPDSEIHHGDIISFVEPPDQKLAYAFVFREVQQGTFFSGGSQLKRKAVKLGSGSKRQRAIRLRASDKLKSDEVKLGSGSKRFAIRLRASDEVKSNEVKLGSGSKRQRAIRLRDSDEVKSDEVKLGSGSKRFAIPLRVSDEVKLVSGSKRQRAIRLRASDEVKSDEVKLGSGSKRQRAIRLRASDEVKSDEVKLGSGSKRQRGIGLGASDGPISLEDFRSLQRSNTELRKQLEDQVKTIDALQNEKHAAIERHETKQKELKDSVSKLYTDELDKLNDALETKDKEVVELNRISSKQKHAMEDLNIRFSSSMQSYTEANEIIDSQKASISKLEMLLAEEQELRREEQEKAAANLKASIQKVQVESQVEIKRLSDAATRREREQQEVILKLQESDKEKSSLVKVLRSKLEATRQNLANSENKNRQLGVQIREEQHTAASGKKRVEELEQGIRSLRKELEDEKAAREEAWAKVSALELEMSAAIRDLNLETHKLKAAREMIMLRETQLRSFYSKTEEISLMFAKQQEQFKTMQRTLEDEENYDNISAELEPNVNYVNMNGSVLWVQGGVPVHHNNSTATANTSCLPKCPKSQVDTSGDEAALIEKHDCDNKGDRNYQDTQVAEFTSEDGLVKGGFGSDLDGLGTTPILEGDTVGTEKVFETESAANDSDRHLDINKLAGHRMQLDDDTLGQDGEDCQMIGGESSHPSASNNPLKAGIIIDDTECTMRTTDLLASETAGSWAYNTGPSVHGENDFPGSKDYEAVAEAISNLHDSGVVAESQSTPSSEVATIKRDNECQALGAKIGLVAPDLKEHFHNVGSDSVREESERGVASNSDTEESTDDEDVNAMETEGAVASK